MYLEALERQIAVCSFDGAERLLKVDKHYWNVVSINGPLDRKAVLPLAKTIHYACFDDVEDPESRHFQAPRDSDIKGISAFVEGLGSSPPLAPLMVHCKQGISRSAAVALYLIYCRLPPAEDRVLRAVDLILELRPQAKPTYQARAVNRQKF